MPTDDPIPAADRLRDEPFAFDFFQAVRLLHMLRPEAAEVGHGGPVDAEPVRFRAHASTSFPPSAVMDLQSPGGGGTAAPTMTVGFFGIYGPKGVLPQRYTEMVVRQEMERLERDSEKGALRGWLDIFNHRLIGLFYRAWEKYRLAVSFERAARRPGPARAPDPFTAALLALVGLGTRGLRDRLDAATAEAHVDDLSLLYFSGALANRTRNAAGLEAILREYFGLDAQIKQFQGRWLMLEEAQQSHLGGVDGRNALGRDAVAGARVWDLRSKVRIRLGPMGYDRFRAFLPDPGRPGALDALSRLVRFHLGPDLDFDVQLILRRDQVPPCQVGGEGGSTLGWNAWAAAGALDNDPGDAIFEEM